MPTQVKLFSGKTEIRNNGRDAQPGERLKVQVILWGEAGLKNIDFLTGGHTVDSDMQVSHQFNGWPTRMGNGGSGPFALLEGRIPRGLIIVIEFYILWRGERGNAADHKPIIRVRVTAPLAGRTPRQIKDLPEEAGSPPEPIYIAPAVGPLTGAPDDGADPE